MPAGSIQIAGLPVPVRRFSRLYHVGSLNPADKGRNGPSHEGHGLSVSTRPDAWEQICKLGGQPWHRLTNDGGRFIDAHEIPGAAMAAIESWAIESGLLAPATRWRVEWFDDERDGTCYMLCKSAAEAATESDELGGTVAEVRVNVATAALSERMGFEVDDLAAPSLALVCWCEDQTDFDGIWWEDDLDVFALSAPRGVILPRALSAWSNAVVPRIVPADDDTDWEEDEPGASEGFASCSA